MPKQTIPKMPIAQRLIAGCFISVAELGELKSVGKSTIYKDIQEGLLPVEKCGQMTRIEGHIAKAYRPRVGIVKAA